MEKQSKINSRKVIKTQDISKRLTKLINETLSNPWENFWDRINYIIDKLIFSIDQDTIRCEDIQKETFDKMCNFLNHFFEEIKIKKFYNNIPKIDLKKYSEKNIGNQIISNVYWKEWKIFYRNEVNWWDCYYWTILLKTIFDKLKSRWLNIQNRIFVYDEDRWHASVIIKFQWEIYLADYWLFNQMFNRVISPIETFNWLYQRWLFTKVSFNRTNDVGIRYFDETNDFIKYINNKKINSAAIEFNPRLMDWKDHSVRIELFKNYITFNLNGRKNKYYFNSDFKLLQLCKNSNEVLDCIIRWLIADRQEKNELKVYFDMIRNKINPKKIYEIFN